MRFDARKILLAAPLLLLTGCPPTGYTGPVEVPSVEAAVPVGAYVALGPYLRGIGAPMPANAVGARCLDETACDVAVVGSEVRIGGKKAGRAEIQVTYQEANGAPGESHVFVQFVDGGIAPLKLGPRDADASDLTTVEQVPIEGRRVGFVCGLEPFDAEQHALADQLDLGGARRGRGVMYGCLMARRLTGAGAYYRFGSLGDGYRESSTPEERAYVCAETRPDGTDYVSLTVYRYVDGVPVVLERRGELSDVCGLKGATPRVDPVVKILSVADSEESAVYKRVTFELRAPSAQGCDVAGYELRWPGGDKSIDLGETLHVDAGATERRTVQVDIADGDLVHLDDREAYVLARARCR